MAKQYRDLLNPGSQGARAGRGLDARERAAALVDDAHLARADHHDDGLPLQRDSVGSQGHARRPPASRRRSGRRSSTRSARSSTIRRSKCAGAASATGRPAARASNTEAFTVIEAQMKKHYDTVDAADHGHRRHRHVEHPRQGASSATASARRSTAKTARRASARIATRSASWSRSCTASCGSSTTWSWSSRGRSDARAQIGARAGLGSRGSGLGENTCTMSHITHARCLAATLSRCPAASRCHAGAQRDAGALGVFRAAASAADLRPRHRQRARDGSRVGARRGAPRRHPGRAHRGDLRDAAAGHPRRRRGEPRRRAGVHRPARARAAGGVVPR